MRFSSGIVRFALAASLVACHGASDSGTDGGAPVLDAGRSSSCTTTCASLGTGFCGSVSVPGCDAPLDCGACRYTAVPVTVGRGHDPVFAEGTDVPTVAFLTPTGPAVATLGAGGWATEPVGPSGSDVYNPRIDMVVAGETRWVAVATSGTFTLWSSTSGGAWQSESPIDTRPRDFALSLDGTGAPLIVVSAFLGGHFGVHLLERVSGTWQHTMIAEGVAGGELVELVVAAGVRHAFWTADGNLLHASGTATLTSDPAFSVPIRLLDVEDHSIDATLGPAGRVGVLAGSSYQLFDGSTWTGVAWGGSSNVLALAIDPNGHAATASDRFAAMVVSERVGDLWADQNVNAECDQNKMDLAYGASGELRVVRSCGNVVTYLTRTGRYPDDYVAACATLTARACGACSGGCLTSGGHMVCESLCPQWFSGFLCGDATQDPTLVHACIGELATPTCNGGLDITGTTSCRQIFH